MDRIVCLLALTIATAFLLEISAADSWTNTPANIDSRTFGGQTRFMNANDVELVDSDESSRDNRPKKGSSNRNQLFDNIFKVSQLDRFGFGFLVF